VFAGTGRGGDLRDHDAWLETCFERSESLLDVPRLRRLWARLREEQPADEPDGPPHPGPRAGRVTRASTLAGSPGPGSSAG